jgi:pyruvate formate lyase activating enzyme
MHLPPTPIITLEKAYDVGKKTGLRFVYLGNVPGHGAENTVCYSCNKIVIERFGYDVRVIGVSGSKCNFCGAELNIKAVGWSRQVSASVEGHHD